MEDYVIYTFGGGEILSHVMNAIALLFKTNNSYFTSAGMLTMAAGLAYATLRALNLNAIPLFFKDWFLPTLLLTGLFFGFKTSINIVDKVDDNFKYNKVDNIPIGIAAIASLSSRIGEYLSENLETVLTTSDSERFSKVGPMFGTRLIHEASKLTIKDPLTRLNIKDFVYQCFEWPYIKSNIAPGRLAAESSTDILGFVESNPHPMLGIYWRESDGRASFLNCKACAVKVRELISVEVNRGLQSLAISLFDSKRDPEAITNHLKKYASDAWGTLAKGSSNIANVVQQQLMLNSYHTASRNKKDELDLGRYDAALIHLEAERGQAVQDTTSLVKSSLSLIQLPNLHTIILALALIFFAIIAPLTFLPRGLTYLGTWIKVMVWVTTWPVFFTVINCVGHMFAAKALNSSLMGFGEGLTIQTQNGLANTAYSAYCLVMGLQYVISFLSWTLISQGGHAFSQLSSSFSQIGESFASKAGNELIDGNVSFDSQTLHHRSVANTQMAQQQLGASMNYGSRFDDGKVALLHGTSGSVVAQEHQHNFGTNVSHNDAFSQMYAMQSQDALSAANQEGLSLQRSVSKGSQELASFAKSVAENKGTNETFGSTESVNFQKQMQNLMGMAERFGRDNNLNTDVAFGALVEGSIGIGGGIGKLFSAQAGLGANFKTGSSDNEIVSKAKSSDIGKQFSEGLNQAVNYALDNKASIGKAFNTQSLGQAQANFSEAETHADSVAANLTKSKSLSEMASHSRQSGTSTVTNANDAMVERIASQFNGDKSAAAQYLAYHSEAGRQSGQKMVDSTDRHQNGSVGSQNDIHSFHANNISRIGSAPTHNSKLDHMRSQNNIAGQETNLDQRISEISWKTQTSLSETEGDVNSQSALIDNQHNAMKNDYVAEKDRSLVGKTFSKADDNLEEFDAYKNTKNKIKNIIGISGDKK